MEIAVEGGCNECHRLFHAEVDSNGRYSCPHCGKEYTEDSIPKRFIQEQRPPIPTNSKPVWDMVIEDMKARDNLGRERYGTPLQIDNGRDFLIDAYQESLDLVVYLRGEIEKRRNNVS